MLAAVLVLVAAGGFFALRSTPKEAAAPAAKSTTPAAQPPPDFAPAKSDAKAIAVLAFANLSSDKDSEYFSGGLSENILDKLARNPGLRVVARTSSFYYKGDAKRVMPGFGIIRRPGEVDRCWRCGDEERSRAHRG